MNNRRNYAYFSDIVLTMREASSATIETSVSAADPTDHYVQPERNEYSNSNEGWQSNATPYD